MQKFTVKYKELLYEKLEDQVKDKLSQDFISIKRNLLDLIEKSVKDNTELAEVQKFIDDYVNTPNNGTLIEFVEEGDIYNFYLKNQNDLDVICNNNKFFDEEPSKKNIFSLYSFIIEGTRFGVLKIMEMLKNEIFGQIEEIK